MNLFLPGFRVLQTYQPIQTLYYFLFLEGLPTNLHVWKTAPKLLGAK